MFDFSCLYCNTGCRLQKTGRRRNGPNYSTTPTEPDNGNDDNAPPSTGDTATKHKLKVRITGAASAGVTVEATWTENETTKKADPTEGEGVDIPENTQVTITVKGANDKTIAWSGNGTSGATETITVTMDADKTAVTVTIS